MNIENIKQLAEILSSHGLTRLEVSEGEIKICLEKAVNTGEPSAVNTTVQKQQVADVNMEQTIDFNNIIGVKAPIVGVFYGSPSPESEPFVKIGSKVRKGDVLCIIEAMKLMNEVVAECDGEIVDICIKNGEIVEYGQIIFKMF